MQDEETRGAARRRVKEPTGPTEEQRKAEIIKNKITENNAGFLSKFVEFRRTRPNRNIVTMLEILRNNIDGYLRDKEKMGFILSDPVANTVPRAQSSRMA